MQRFSCIRAATHLPTDLSMVRLQMTANGGTSCDGPASLIDSGLNLRATQAFEISGVLRMAGTKAAFLSLPVCRRRRQSACVAGDSGSYL